ncbi:TAP-like protein-domain-containing protein [Xylariaceae sp. FL0255]|nr:TAP-like protein-domain-containing protein [Xylariaceae sp. FL0255]
MHISTRFLVFGLPLFSEAACSHNCTWDTIVPSKSLRWCSCNDGFYCAKLDAPLDYQNPTLGRATISLVKLPANSNSSYGAYQGMILTNPGGPGASSVDDILENGVTYYQSITGDNWDIVGFDPRGIYLSEPNINNCSTLQNTPLSARFVPEETDDFFNSYIQAGIEIGQACRSSVGWERDAGPHMSTTVNARDMLTIVEAFAKTTDGARAAKPSNLLNYFGYSYGTFLGQVFASMYPDRVGNMVLDGVLSLDLPLGVNLTQISTPADGVIASFFVYCFAAGQSACSYYTGSSALDIYARFNESFVQLDAQRAKAEGWANATDIESALVTLKTVFFDATEAPVDVFPLIPSVLAGLEEALAISNVAAWTQEIIATIGDPTPAGDKNAELRLGILCADQGGKWYNETLEDVTPLITHLEKTSIIGELVAESDLGCLGWSIQSIDVFSGPFGGDTATPILFVGNTYDPIAPVTNALMAASNYKGAQVITIDAVGHTSRVANSTCQKAKVNNYFQHTQLPGNDSYCSIEAGPFGVTLNGTLEKLIGQAGLSVLDQ